MAELKTTLLSEIKRRNYERIRLNRVEYQNNNDSYIDIRIFHGAEDYDEEGNDITVFHPTKKGVQIKEDDFQQLLSRWRLMPSTLIHPKIFSLVWSSFESEQYDTAVFEAFKQIEIEVREKSDSSAELVGVKLMRNAFNPEKGVLANINLPYAEREAMSHLFSSSIGLYKNPCSHRSVGLSFNQAFEAVLLASHLMNILDRIQIGS